MAEKLEKALNSVFSLFESRLGLRRETLGGEIEIASRSVIEQLSAEPDDDTILIESIRYQSKDQKAQ